MENEIEKLKKTLMNLSVPDKLKIVIRTAFISGYTEAVTFWCPRIEHEKLMNQAADEFVKKYCKD